MLISKFLLVFSVFSLVACGGASPKKNNDAPADGSLSFPADIAPILAAKCSPCHNEGKQPPAIVGNEANFRAAADAVAFAITTDDPARMMPLRVKPRVLADADKATLLGFTKSPDTYDFAIQIDPILKAKCAPCHAEGGHDPILVGQEATARAEVADLAFVLTTSDPQKAMPKQSKQKDLSPEEKDKLLAFLGK